MQYLEWLINKKQVFKDLLATWDFERKGGYCICFLRCFLSSVALVEMLANNKRYIAVSFTLKLLKHLLFLYAMNAAQM